MYARDCAIRPGQSVTIEVSNKPYADQSIPPESNDYRWADSAEIEIWTTECEEKLVDEEMTPITGRPGWYTYRFQTTEAMTKGIYRVVVRLTTETPSTSGTSSISTSGTSGNPSTDVMTDVKVSYFTIMDLY